MPQKALGPYVFVLSLYTILAGLYYGVFAIPMMVAFYAVWSWLNREPPREPSKRSPPRSESPGERERSSSGSRSDCQVARYGVVA